MKKIILISLIIFSSYAHSALTLASFEKIGFVKVKQPAFQILGAKDGWKGIYQKMEVEIYFYEDKSKMPLNTFKGMAKANSMEFCIIENVLIVEKNIFLCKDAKSKL